MKIIIDARWIRSINLDGIANFTLNTTIELLKYKEYHYLILVNSNEIKALVEKYLKEKETVNFDFLITPIAITSLKNYYLLIINQKYFFLLVILFYLYLPKK